MSRKLDAEIAERVFGLTLLGMHPCSFHEHALVSPNSSNAPDLVYLHHCACDLTAMHEEEESWPTWDATRIGTTGHSWHCADVVPHYSGNVYDAWTVIEHLRPEMWCKVTAGVKLATGTGIADPAPQYDCQFGRYATGKRATRSHEEVSADTLPEAVCRAAIAAVSVREAERAAANE